MCSQFASPDSGRQPALGYRCATEADLPAIADLLARGMGLARGAPSPRLLAWPARDRRLIGPADAPMATLSLWRSAMVLGGRDVATVGLSGVAVAPEMRGRGIGRAAIRCYQAEMRAEGYALGVLYPANWPFYRRTGAELAGHQWRRRYPLKELASLSMPADTTVRRLPVHAWPALDALYEKLRPLYPGHMRRAAWRWPWSLRPDDGTAIDVYVLDRQGDAVGYVALCPDVETDRVLISDAMVADGAAARAALALAGSFAGVVSWLEWMAGPADPLSAAIPDKHWTLVRERRWMARVFDLPACLGGRGYPPGISATLTLSVDDADLPENTGGWALHVADGVAEITPVRTVPADALSLSARGLSALVTGGQPAAALAHQGLLSGPARTVALAGLLFGGPEPWLQEFF
jgi:predicted acetyltransferase